VSRYAKAIIDCEAILANYRLAKSRALGSRALAVVKADAYGHGAIEVAKALAVEADAFAVACIEEALALRDAGIRQPILLLEGFFSEDEVALLAHYQLWTCVHNHWQIQQLAKLPDNARVQVWLKMDSGMHRLGLSPNDFAPAYAKLSRLPQISHVVAMTHLACADERHNPATETQLACFAGHIEGVEQQSIANSAAILAWPNAHKHWLRPGLMLYGASPFADTGAKDLGLKPGMQLISEVIALRQIAAGESVGYGGAWQAERSSLIATVAMGYGDGYPRHTKMGTAVAVAGQRAPLVGRVSMDMITLDVTDVEDVCLGSEVEFWGPQIEINDVADSADTIPYTLMTGLTPRIPRLIKRRTNH